MRYVVSNTSYYKLMFICSNRSQ